MGIPSIAGFEAREAITLALPHKMILAQRNIAPGRK